MITTAQLWFRRVENGEIDDFTNLPTKTLDIFCSSLASGSYQDAYDETSTAYQGSHSESDFVESFSRARSCTYNPPSQANNHLAFDMNITFGDGSMIPYTSFLVRDSNNAKWKIDELFNFPNQVLTTFCNDLANQNYQDAYSQLSSDTQAKGTLQAFTQNYSNVAKCSFTFPVQTASQATTTITFTLSAGGRSEQVATLTEVGIDDWKIQSLQNS